MKKNSILFLLFITIGIKAQTKLYLDSMLKVAYISKYHFSENLICIPFYCDPFYSQNYKQTDTSMCGKYVFVNKNFDVKIKPIFQLPCNFEPKFGESLCAVNIKNELVFIDTNGAIKINTKLSACSPHKNKIIPFNKGKAKIYKGNGAVKNFYDIYYIDKQGKRIKEKVLIYVKPKNKPFIVSNTTKPIDKPVFDLPLVRAKNKYHLKEVDALMLLKKYSHKNNRMLLYYSCGEYQIENMASEDTLYCGKFVFVDTLFNVKISSEFTLPCAFEPEFSEGLAAVSIDSQIVYIDTIGRLKIKTGLHSCNKENNKATTFKNGIATLYKGDIKLQGNYTTTAINSIGERVRLLEFDELELAEKMVDRFSNLTIEETANCFVGKGKTNGIWFLIEKSGKIRKKLNLK